MGCVFGKEVQSSGPPGSDYVVRERESKGGERNLSVPSRRKEREVVSSVSKSDAESNAGVREAQNGREEKNEEPKDEGSRRPRGERRRSRPNPRLSNPPKHIHGEQVAAGWPSWLSAVAGEAINGMSCSLYLVFDYMEHDLAGLASSPSVKFTESQVKCYMHQLLSGLEHCHNRHVLHRDIKGSNLLIDDGGILKIADFGLASTFDPNNKQPMTSRVVTLWYRPPELLLGATEYGVGIDLWSAGCILAELFAGKPIMTGRTEVEQLHRIFKLCGSPSDEYWKKSKLPHATIFKPQHSYKRCIKETFKEFPASALPLIDTLLAIDPSERLTATSALNSEFFSTEPYACDPSSLPKYPPSKEMDAKRRDEEARRLRAAGKTHTDVVKKTRTRDRGMRAMPAPEANAELQANIDRRRLFTHANAKSKSEKFPPPHQDAGIGFPLGSSNHIDPNFDPQDVHVPFTSMNFSYAKEPIQTWSGPLVDPSSVKRKSKPSKKDHRKARD
ncbi:protein kinase superfamily protein [Striga asiatica]|uniref:Protein kinase superfamily protein n=1 Tax=Striga asiatica TaxID=4170 RepID=A0A5A7PKK2_STRAF|nr:protein kinase superfamily protein [Striga asiatica]